MKAWANRQKGFTIVELLIVIVVIAILAAITIVAYNGIQERARASAVSSALNQANKKITVWQVDNPGQYPADLASAGITNTGSVSFQYTVDNSTNPPTYCMTATTSSTSYKASSSATTPVSGGCPGHSQGGVAAITNYAPNPNAAGASVAAFGFAGSPVTTTRSIASDQSHSGTTSLKTVVTGASGQTGVMARPPVNSLQVNTGEKVNWSFWVYSTKAGTPTVYVEGTKVSDGSYTGASSGTVSIPANTWTKVTGTYTAPLDMRVTQIGMYNLVVVTNDIMWADEFMVQKGATLNNYADGDSADWAWNGTANNATSTGPPQ